MFGIQSKIARHAERQENMTHNTEKSQSTETDTEIVQMIDPLNKYVKIVIISIFYMFQEVEEGQNMLSRDMEYIYEKDSHKISKEKRKKCLT